LAILILRSRIKGKDRIKKLGREVRLRNQGKKSGRGIELRKQTKEFTVLQS
jgi:hypothetical protein